MGLFDNKKYPWINMHGMNLDWIIQTVKDLFTKVEDLEQEFEDFDNTYETKDNLTNVRKLSNGADFTGTWFGSLPADIPLQLASYVNVKEYGAVGDGVTDDTVAFQTAFDLNNGMIFIPDGAYRMFDEIDVQPDTKIVLSGKAIIKVDDTFPVASKLFKSEGVAGVEYTIQNPVEGGYTVDMLLGEENNFAEGDLVKIGSSDLYDSLQTATQTGELNFVQSVEVGQIILKHPLQDQYTTSPFIQKITPVENITFEGGKIEGKDLASNDTIGIFFQRAINCHVENVRTERFDFVAVGIEDSVGCTVSKSRFEKVVSNSTGYAISFRGASQDCQAFANYFKDVRHSLSTNSPGGEHGVVRRINFHDNVVYRSEKAIAGSGGDAVDTHGASEDVKVINNTIIGSTNTAINIEGRSCEILNNTIDGTSEGDVLINVKNVTDRTGEVIICKNKIKGGTKGINISPAKNTTIIGYDSISIEGNTIKKCTSTNIDVNGLSSVIKAENVTIANNNIISDADDCIYCRSIDNLVIEGNNCKMTADSTNYVMYLRDIATGTISTNVMNADVEGGRGIYNQTNDKLTFVGNVFKNTKTSGKSILLSDDCSNIYARGNNLDSLVQLGAGVNNDLGVEGL